MAVIVDISAMRQEGMLSQPAAPSAANSDGEGGYTDAYTPLSPPLWRFAIEKISAKAAERLFSATVTAHATHVLTGRFHPGITTRTRIVWTDKAGVHTADVLDVDDTEGAGAQSVVLVSEIAP